MMIAICYFQYYYSGFLFISYKVCYYSKWNYGNDCLLSILLQWLLVYRGVVTGIQGRSYLASAKIYLGTDDLLHSKSS